MNKQTQLVEFFDHYFSTKMAKYHIPGAAFAIIYKNQIFLDKGYGYANLETKTLVNSEKTLFRLASLSNLFTAVAVLQLVNQGLIQLDDPINPYLAKLNISLPFTITIAQLLSHRDGFEERLERIITTDPRELKPLKEILCADLTPPVIKPGEMITYGGWGMVLLSYLIEDITQVSFVDYINRFVFKQNGFLNSTASQPVPSDLKSNLATTYFYCNKSEQFVPSPEIYVNTAATGGLSSSISDLARFVSMLFSGNRYSQIFKNHFNKIEQIPGTTLGLFEHIENGQKAFIRDGSGIGVRARILMIPKDKIGFVFASNARCDDFCDELTSEFFNIFYKKINKTEPVQTSIFTSVNCEKFKGYYRYLQYNRSSFTKIFGLFMNNLQVTSSAQHHDLFISSLPPFGDFYGDFNKPTRLVARDAEVFQREDNNGLVAFRQDSASKDTFLFSGSGCHGSYYKLAWYENPFLHQLLFVASVMLFIIFLGGGFSRYLFDEEPLPSPLKYIWYIPALISLFNLSFIGAVFHYLLQTKDGMPLLAFLDKRPINLYLGFTAGYVGLVSSVVFLGYLVCTQVLLQFSFLTNMYFLGFVFIDLFFIWLATYWNLYVCRNFKGLGSHFLFLQQKIPLDNAKKFLDKSLELLNKTIKKAFALIKKGH